jgi:hypothetical protein
MNRLRTMQGQGSTPSGPQILIRSATPADRPGLVRLAQLDSSLRLAGTVLIAERADEPVAAIELDSGSVIADPFQPTADVTAMLRMRRRHLVGNSSARRRRRRPGLRRRCDPRAAVDGRV